MVYLSYYSFGFLPKRENIPDDPIVSESREEGDGRLPFLSPARATHVATHPLRREVAPHREAAACEDGSMRRSDVAIVRTVLSYAM